MTNWPAIGGLVAIELAVLFSATVRAFNAEARVEENRDDDIRTAIAGYEAGSVVPMLAALVEAINSIRRDGESVADALLRSDVSSEFGSTVVAAVASEAPRRAERRLIRNWTALAWSLLAAQIAAPVFLYDALVAGNPVPWILRDTAGIILAAASFIAAVSALSVRRANQTLSRAIRDGKSAGEQTHVL